MQITIHNIHLHPALPVAALTELSTSSADARTPDADKWPAIGAAWPTGGTYAGIAKGQDGQPDHYLVLLDDKPAADGLQWDAAMAWAASLGEGASLPTRDESALLYAHLRDKFDASKWHWISTQHSEGIAWNQSFVNGSQSDNGKSFQARARAVRRFPV